MSDVDFSNYKLNMDKFVENSKPIKLEKIPPGKIKNRLNIETRDKFSLESINSNRKQSFFDNPPNLNMNQRKKLRQPTHKSTNNQSELMADSSYLLSNRDHNEKIVLPEPSISLILTPVELPKTTRYASKVRRNIKIYGTNINPKASSKSNNSRKTKTVHNSSI